MKTITRTTHNGFVILFVVLIASIILLIGAGIFTISFKQNILSSTSRESQLAFAAADTGIECALYYGQVAMLNVGSTINCGGAVVNVDSVSGSNLLKIDVPLNNVYGISGADLPCVRVFIDKDYYGLNLTTPYTRMISHGYNVCEGSTGQPATDNPLLLERVLDVRYANPVVTGGTNPGMGGVPSTGGGTGSGTGGGTSGGGASLGGSASASGGSGQ